MKDKTELLKTLCKIDNEVGTAHNLFNQEWNTLMLIVSNIMDICFEEDDKYDIDLISKFYDIRDCIPDITQTYKACLDFSTMYLDLIDNNSKFT